MKKRIFHIAISVTLFCILTVVYILLSGDKETVFSVSERTDGSEIMFTKGERFECVGVPLEILLLPERVKSGDEVSVAFKGESNTEYNIKVYYPSGLSETDVFTARKSDSKGRVGWDFTVAETATAGKLRIVITGEKTHFLTETEITD